MHIVITFSIIMQMFGFIYFYVQTQYATETSLFYMLMSNIVILVTTTSGITKW